MPDYSDALSRDPWRKHGERPSVLDFIPTNLHSSIRQGTCSTDLQPYFADAHDALPRGGTLWIPMGVYPLGATWALSKTLNIVGNGDGFDESACSTVLMFADGVTGITLLNNQAERTVMRDFLIQSESVAAGTDDGIVNQSNGVKITQVTIRGFGRYGLSTNTRGAIGSPNPNANSSEYTHVRAFANYSHGFYTSGHDSNQLKFTLCSASRNQGYGFYEEHDNSTANDWYTFNNTYDTCHTETNWLGSYFTDGSDIVYLNPYAEPDGPAGTANVSGTTVTRVTGQSYSSSMTGLGIIINNTLYYIASVTNPNVLVLSTSAGVISGATTVVRINQRAELGAYAQYTTWVCGTQFLNTPLISPINQGLTGIQLVGGTDNSTHLITQLGRYSKRLSVRGMAASGGPKFLLEDTTPPVTGTCNTSGTTVTRVTGAAFSSILLNSPITINNVQYLIDINGFYDANTVTLTTSAGTQSGVAYSIQVGRQYEFRSGAAAEGAYSMQDLQTGDYPWYYVPAFGHIMTRRLSLSQVAPNLVLSDTTPTTGRAYSHRSGATGPGQWSVINETNSEIVLRYDPSGRIDTEATEFRVPGAHVDNTNPGVSVGEPGVTDETFDIAVGGFCEGGVLPGAFSIGMGPTTSEAVMVYRGGGGFTAANGHRFVRGVVGSFQTQLEINDVVDAKLPLVLQSDLKIVPFAGLSGFLKPNALGIVNPEKVDLQSNQQVEMGGSDYDFVVSFAGRLAPLNATASRGYLDVYSKSEVDTLLANYYTKGEVDGLLAGKADSPHTHGPGSFAAGGDAVTGTSGTNS